MAVRIGKVNTEKFTIFPYEYIFNGNDDGERVSVCIPRAYLRMLQSQSGRFLWFSSYRLEGERVTLSDSERELLRLGTTNLFFGFHDGCDEGEPPVIIDDDDNEIVFLHDLVKQFCCCSGGCKMCNCGCGCGCGDGTSTIIPPPTPGIDPIGPPLDDGIGDFVQNGVWCRRFSWLVATWVGTLGAIQGGAAAGIQLTATWLAALLSQRLGAMGLYLAGLLSTMSNWLISNTTWSGMFEAMSDTDTLRALVCAIYTADSPQQASQQFKGVIAESSATWYQRILLNLWRGVIHWNSVFSDSAWVAMEAVFPGILTTPLNCSCEGVPEPPPPGGLEEPTELPLISNWYAVPLAIDGYVGGAPPPHATAIMEGWSHVYNANTPDGSGTNLSVELMSEYLTSTMRAGDGIYGDDNLHGGYVVIREQTSGNVRLGSVSTSGIIGVLPEVLAQFEVHFRYNSGCIVDRAEMVAALQNIFGGTSWNDAGNLNYQGNAGNARMRYTRTGSELTAGSRVQVWAIVNGSVLVTP